MTRDVLLPPPCEMPTFPCTTPRCGQPVPADAQPGDRCLACGQPIKLNRRPRQ